MAAGNRSHLGNCWLRIYKNAVSSSYRVDLGVPAKPGAGRTTHAYVGTIAPMVSRKGVVSFEGALRALNSDDLRSDFAMASRGPGGSRVALLVLREVPFKTPRHRVRRLKGTFIVAAGRFAIEARYGTGEAFIVGTMIARHPQARASQNKALPRSRVTARRPK